MTQRMSQKRLLLDPSHSRLAEAARASVASLGYFQKSSVIKSANIWGEIKVNWKGICRQVELSLDVKLRAVNDRFFAERITQQRTMLLPIEGGKVIDPKRFLATNTRAAGYLSVTTNEFGDVVAAEIAHLRGVAAGFRRSAADIAKLRRRAIGRENVPPVADDDAA